MARHEADREDLMQEATGLVRRIELTAPHEPTPVVIGFKRNGAWSVYFGGEPVYQFDEQHRLRRAFVDGCLWRTQGTTLARLKRERTDTETTLIRHDLTPSQLIAFLAAARARIADLLTAWEASEVTFRRQVPADGDLASEALLAIRSAIANGVQLAPAFRAKA